MTTTEVRARTLKFQRAANRVVRALLAAPLVGRLAGRRLLTLYVVGRSSGRRYTVPVAYVQDGDRLLIGTPFAWARNLRSGDQLTLRLRGRRRRAEVQMITDEDGVVDWYAQMCRKNHQFAKFNAIALDEAGEPRSEDLHAAWRAGARVLRLGLV